ncbi:MAG: hypothetical protein FWF43_04025 [Propionibacteriaceae bacterium]|nr:hypothetical protein [Propionibacteriaceae bacterium]
MVLEDMVTQEFRAVGAEVVHVGVEEFLPGNRDGHAHRSQQDSEPCPGCTDSWLLRDPVPARWLVGRRSTDVQSAFTPPADPSHRHSVARDASDRIRACDDGGRSGLGADLVVFVTEEVQFADSGGPVLKRVAVWAQQQCVPVIAVARQCWISTRELRTVGVEAGYAMAGVEDVRSVVGTWIPR